jgi:formate/nitrite transporter FocA (FNT family)
MMVGAPISVGELIVKNFIPVTLGNYLGAACLAVPYWYVYWLRSFSIDIVWL